MERTRLTALAVWLFLSAVESQPLTILVDESLINAVVGQPVLLSVRPSVRVRSGSWKHNGTDVAVWINTNPDINNVYTGRVELLFPNASLLLKSVSVPDSGEYTVTMNSFSNTAATARMELFVFEPISSVYITSNGSNPVRENDTVWLTCNVLGNYNQRIWSFNGTDVESNERIIFSSENATLTILGVNASNSGEYQCIARNPVSEKTSEPYFLHISYPSDQEDRNESMLVWVIIPAILVPFLMTFCAILTRIRINCCDGKCSCSFLSRYIFYFWVSCCNNDALEDITDNQETGNLAGTWIACCSSRSEKECDSPCMEEPRTLSGLSMSCCSSVSRNKSELQDETKTENHCGALLSCCSGRSPDESGWIRHCCCTWISCCKTGLKGNVEVSNYRGIWMSCCDRGLQKDEQSQEHNQIRELCDCWIACCNKRSEESIGIYTNPITSTTGQQQLSNFSWTSTVNAPAAGEPARRDINKEHRVTKSTAKEIPVYAVVNKEKKMGNDTVNHGQNPPITKSVEHPCQYADLKIPDAGSNSQNVTFSKSEVNYSSLKF